MKIFKRFYFWLPVTFFAISITTFLLFSNTNDVGNAFLFLILIGIINPINWSILAKVYEFFPSFEEYDFSLKFTVSLFLGLLIWLLIGLLIDKIISRLKKDNT